MLKSAVVFCAFTLVVCAQTPKPVIDNDRVAVWDVTTTLPPAQHDFVAVSLSHVGSASWHRKGDTPGKAGERTVVIELKDHTVPPLENKSGYPNAFPRPRSIKLFENERVVVWSYRWKPGEPTPMHFHDKDVVVVYEEPTSLDGKSPDGKVVHNDYKAAEIRFNPRDRTHAEILSHGSGSAVMTELK